MSSRPISSSIRARLTLAGLLTLMACDQWALSIGGNGLVFVGVIGDTHGTLPGRYRVRTRQADVVRVLEVPASGQLDLSGFEAGPLELTLVVPDDCRVTSPNPRTLMISGDQPVNAAFEVRCGA